MKEASVFKIEKASLKDSEKILKLLNSSQNLFGYKGEQFTLVEIRDYIKAKHNLVFVAKEKNEIIGTFIANLWSDYCYLYLLIVDKKYRGLGLGTKMLNFLEQKAKKAGYIGLITKESDEKMINLIKKRGYIKGDKFVYFHKNL